MADKHIVVTAPYVTLKVRDTSGQWAVRGVYEGGRFPVGDVDEESLRHHLDSDLVTYADAESDAASEPVVEPAPAGTDGKPAGNASRDTWAAYATTKGAPDEETRPVDEGGLGRDELRARYGN